MSKDSKPQIIDSAEIFRGRVFSVTVDTIVEAGITYQREVVHHRGSAVIVPILPDGNVALVRQYRHPAVRYLLEFPAGTLNEGEAPEEGAARELEEELGMVAGRWEKLSEFFVSPGFCEEKMWLYLATDLEPTRQQLEADELLSVVPLSLTQAVEMVSEGEIQDAKTIIGLLLVAPRMRSGISTAEYPAV